MPISRGDVDGSAVAKIAGQPEISDFKTALDVLKNDYSRADGMDVKQLIDSDKRGALTYNDFLILPGFVGMIFTFDK